jgi:hypothetical protein
VSAERNYKCFLNDHKENKKDGQALADIASMDSAAIEKWAGLDVKRDEKKDLAPGGDGEDAIKRKLSVAIGRVMESHYGTRIPVSGPEKGIRINEVPEIHAQHMNRLRDELYAKVVPVEAAAD